MMTILTLIWEVSFISSYSSVTNVANSLLRDKTHVWTNDYNLSYILPWKLSSIFYGEYGAYADRDYMNLSNDWSRVIEGTHAIFCGTFALLTIVFKARDNELHFLITSSISMGSQLMNSILYMSNYLNETHNPDSVNYNDTSFPTGIALSKRPFMYVNIFWSVMPFYAIIRLLCLKNWVPKKTPGPFLNDGFQDVEIASYNYI